MSPPPMATLEYGTQDTAMEEGTQTQTPPSHPTQEESEENYVATTGEFHSRLKFWLATLTIVDMYPVQLAIVFKAGSVVNLNQLQKEGKKYKETATKYKALCDDLKRRNILSAVEYEAMKTLKHLPAEKGETVVEVIDWPSGKSLWDRYMKSKRTIRKDIGPAMPKDLKETPSGTGLKRSFEKVALKLYKDPTLNSSIKKKTPDEMAAMEDPHDAILQAEIDRKGTKPFNLLLTARIFFDSPVLKADVKQAQEGNSVQSRSQLKKEANMKRALAAAAADKQKRDKEEAEQEAEKKRQRRIERETMKANVSKANSMAEIARNESLKSFFSISQAIYSPNTLKQKMEPALQSIQAIVATPAKLLEMEENDDDCSVVEVTASGSKTTSTSSITSPTLETNRKQVADDASSDGSGSD